MVAMPEVQHMDELYIPGPVDIRPEVLEAMSQPPYGHRVAEEIGPYIASIRKNLFEIVNASEDTHSMVLTGGSGTNMLEMAVRSWAEPHEGERSSLVYSIGLFGTLWYEIFESCDTAVGFMISPDGEIVDLDRLKYSLEADPPKILAVTHNDTSTGTVNPLSQIAETLDSSEDTLFFVDAVSSLGGMEIDVTAWGIDFLAAAPQKGLGVPPGLSLAVVSNVALEKVQSTNRGFATDVVRQVEVNRDNMTLTTPPEAQIGALALQLAYIIEEEGVNKRYARHNRMAAMVRDWGEAEGFELLPERANASNMLSCFINTRELNLTALQRALRNNVPIKYSFDAGHPKLSKIRREKGLPDTFRIAHMGDRPMVQLERYLEALSDYIQLV